MSIKDTSKISCGRSHCLACGHLLYPEPLLALPGMPKSAQDIPAAEELPADEGVTLRLRQCPHCGLFQFDCNPVSYYREVVRAVGLSETMRKLRRDDYRHMIETYGLSGGKWLECGCGRGEFMEVLKEFPVRISATEASEEFAADARKLLGEGCSVQTFFPERAEECIEGAPFDCFCSFNFLEHQPDPSAMLSCLWNNLRPGGYGLITVPSFEYILQKGRYYELIRDHIANYTMESLTALCEGCGFTVLEKGFIGIGDTLRVIVQKPLPQNLNDTVHEACLEILTAFRNTSNMITDVSVLAHNYETLRAQMADFTERLAKRELSLALFGAGHQGFTIAATTALAGSARYIMDSAPFKQGRFAPASHIPIVAPEHFREDPVDVVMITAPGYVREIEALLRARFPEYPDLLICTIEPESWPI